MVILACDWLLFPTIILSELADISDRHNANLAFIGSVFPDETGLYRLRLGIKGDKANLQAFIENLPEAYHMTDWYVSDEEAYSQGILFSQYWNQIEDSERFGFLDGIIRPAFRNETELENRAK